MVAQWEGQFQLFFWIHIFMNKMERDIVIPIAPSLYKRYVDDTFAKRKKTNLTTYIML